MRQSWSSKPTTGKQLGQNSVMPMHARRVMVKNTRTPAKNTTRPPIPRADAQVPGAMSGNRDITIAYARCLEMMMTAPMAHESEKWRETIMKAKPNRQIPNPGSKPCIKRYVEVVNENSNQDIIEEVSM